MIIFRYLRTIRRVQAAAGVNDKLVPNCVRGDSCYAPDEVSHHMMLSINYQLKYNKILTWLRKCLFIFVI